MIVGVGFDLVQIDRVERLLAAHGDRALAKLFSDVEAAYAQGRARPALHLAARLAAKEAAFKALAGSDEARRIGWREIHVANDHHGRPILLLDGRAAARAAELGVTGRWLTLTHTATTAGAMVVLERDADAGAPAGQAVR